MIPKETIEDWQLFWEQLLDMAYKRKDICTYYEYSSEYDPDWVNTTDFEKITFEYSWRKYSSQKDEYGRYIEPLEVPELKELVVHSKLFRCLGSGPFMKVCFPNCVITFVE